MYKPKRLKLSLRMKLFLDSALQNDSFWDLCCDHGYVGLGALVLNNHEKSFTSVYFVDQVSHIMKSLQLRIDHLYNKPNIPYALYCLPAEDLDVDLTGTVLIAGVGGFTIKKILSNLLSKNKLKAKRLLLSPHTDVKILEEYIAFDEYQKCYFLKDKLSVVVGKKEKPFYILDQKNIKEIS
ncbi:MAG: hypothetical protein HOP07_03600 [Bacteriovoracaceae bacterium]|nr:hypothetical protein [Bacteriovoracaceae bacterium]